MMQIFTGKILSIRKDKNFNGKRLAEVDIKPDSMYFFAKRKHKVGQTVELHKEENSMGYSKILVIFAPNEQNTDRSNT